MLRSDCPAVYSTEHAQQFRTGSRFSSSFRNKFAFWLHRTEREVTLPRVLSVAFELFTDYDRSGPSTWRISAKLLSHGLHMVPTGRRQMADTSCCFAVASAVMKFKCLSVPLRIAATLTWDKFASWNIMLGSTSNLVKIKKNSLIAVNADNGEKCLHQMSIQHT
jgi:hypothetical protein